MKAITIEIVNWAKYNPKRDQQTYTWLRLDNGIATDPDLFGLDAEQRFLWICILCEASRKNSGVVTLNEGYLEHITGIHEVKVHETLEFLSAKPMIRIHDRARSPNVVGATVGGELTESVTTPTYERTNVRTNDSCGEESAQPTLSPKITRTVLWDSTTSEMLERVKPDLEAKWLNTYGDAEWIRMEIRKADAWCAANGKRAPKSGWGRFLNNWLSNGWEKYRKSIPSRAPGSAINVKPLALEDIGK